MHAALLHSRIRSAVLDNAIDGARALNSRRNQRFGIQGVAIERVLPGTSAVDPFGFCLDSCGNCVPTLQRPQDVLNVPGRKQVQKTASVEEE